MSLYLVLAAQGVFDDEVPCPDWYALASAAKYWNVAPWELQEQSIYWTDRAIIAQSAEHDARERLKKMGNS